MSLYVGIRSTFYRISTVVGQGLLVVLAGAIETGTGLDPVNVGVEVDPYVEWQAPIMADLALQQPADPSEMNFFTGGDAGAVAVKPPAVVEIDGVPMTFASYAAMMRDSVRRANESNGFVASTSEAGLDASAVKTAEGPGAFTRWVAI